MKRIVLFIIICCALVSAHAELVKVTMKNGTVFTGELKEFVPTDHVTVIVAGLETTIPISEVASVDNPNAHPEFSIQQRQQNDDIKLQYGKYAITDTKEYPNSFTLKIGNQELTMVLVRGGWFNMGYDGRYSLSWDSEPVHRVYLSSYYVSTQYLSCYTAETILKKDNSHSVKPYNCKYRKDAEELIENISMLSGAPYRLLTEAEWEYAALMPFSSTIFRNENDIEWCSDHWGKYSAADQVNPQGPSSGKGHVLRSYSSDNEKWKRMNANNQYSGKGPFVRIAISADQIQETEQAYKSVTIPDSFPLYGKYEITDTKQYPDSFVLHVGNQELTMILVRGGWFNMGYDGRHSSSWNTEPIHKVNLSSYYVCTQLISHSVVNRIINPKAKESNDNPYVCAYRKDVDKVVSSLITEIGMPIRLMTEAEWEYASLMPFANKIFWFSNCLEWCSDFWGDYEKEEQTNPQGPQKGKIYVLRSFTTDDKKWCRTRSAYPSMNAQADKNACIRIVISADCVTF